MPLCLCAFMAFARPSLVAAAGFVSVGIFLGILLAIGVVDPQVSGTPINPPSSSQISSPPPLASAAPAEICFLPPPSLCRHLPYSFGNLLSCCSLPSWRSFPFSAGLTPPPSLGIPVDAPSISGNGSNYILRSSECADIVGSVVPSTTIALRGPSALAYASSSTPLCHLVGGLVSFNISVVVATCSWCCRTLL